MEDLQQALVSKIEALFRKAESSQFPAEREAFQAKALALMTKHRIERVNLDVAANEVPGNTPYGKVSGSYAPYHHSIIGAVAKLYDCKTFYIGSGRPGDPARTIFVFGYTADAKRVLQVASAFTNDAVAQAARYRTADPNTTIRYRKSFLAGYAAAISKRYLEAKRLLDEEQAGWSTSSNALVLANRMETVQAEYQKMQFKRSTRSKQTLSYDGFSAGKTAGRNSNIGRQTVDSSKTQELGR